MIPRLCNPLKTLSFFLFGARGTGKTNLLRSIFTFKNVLWIDLLKDYESIRYLRDSSTLEREIKATFSSSEGEMWVVIDEVQKVPALLDEVHRLAVRRNLAKRLSIWSFLSL
jgi:predicted AAA+ superfamily ATPase